MVGQRQTTLAGEGQNPGIAAHARSTNLTCAQPTLLGQEEMEFLPMKRVPQALLPTEAGRAHTTNICTHASSLTSRLCTAKSQGAGQIRRTMHREVQRPTQGHKAKKRQSQGPISALLTSNTSSKGVGGLTDRDGPIVAGPEVELVLVTILPALPSQKPPLIKSTGHRGSLWEEPNFPTRAAIRSCPNCP